MQFRKDINGLRAIAVIAVVLFHFNASWMPGGFAGVDVFFVISGFLMTGMIFRGMEQENFSILKFYVSRANRIIPPLAVLCAVLLLLGYFFMTSWDYKTLGRDVSTSMSFVSSVMFSLRGGYFEAGDNFLLHTWSLSTEWQFYIIYPLILIGLKKTTSISSIKKIVVIACILGFIYSIYSTFKWPNASYYLLPSRAWEMLIGGVAYLYPFTLKNKKKELLEWTGIAMVAGSYFLISEDNLWPGYLAIFPVLGVYFIIQAQINNSLITSNIFFQKIGAWSYSIYLWHWPIAVSFSYYGIDEKYKALGILLSVFIGFLSFTYIEGTRIKVTVPMRALTAYALLIVCLGSFGAYIFKTQGISFRVNLASNSLIHGGTADDYIIHEGLSLLNTKKTYDYLLIGDSNANHYVRGILHKGTKVKNSWYATCMSFPRSMNTRDGFYSTWKSDCKNNYKIGLDESKDIIIAQSWAKSGEAPLECTTDKCTLKGDYFVDLRAQLSDLLDIYGGGEKSIYIIGQLPKPINNKIMTCLKSEHIFGLSFNCEHNAEPDHIGKDINTILSSVASNYHNVFFIDPFDAICNDGLCSYSKNNKSIFMPDGSHLSGYGSEVMWDYIMEKIDTQQ